jgi:hypothetical protein
MFVVTHHFTINVESGHTVLSESIHTLWLFKYFVVTAWISNGLNREVVSLAYTQYPVMSKWSHVFRNVYKWIKYEKLICLESISIQPLCYDKPK